MANDAAVEEKFAHGFRCEWPGFWRQKVSLDMHVCFLADAWLIHVHM